MSNYGVIPAGFSRKPLAVTLAEIENALITEFGPKVVQTPQSPLGQINGLFADMVTELWELAEDIYQSYDVDQAEGTRLDVLGKLRLIRRGSDESDDPFRHAISNQSTARISLSDLSRAVRGVPGVTYRHVFVNETRDVDSRGLPANTIAVAALGGDDGDLATAVNMFVIPGISTYGNTPITALDEEGFCRTVFAVRPIEVPTRITVTVRTYSDERGCPPPAQSGIENTMLQHLTANDTRPLNGERLSDYLVRQFVESTYSTVEFVALSVDRDDPSGDPADFAFFEIAQVESVDVVIV